MVRMIGFTLAAMLGARSIAAQQPGGLARLGWISGCWQLRAGQRVIDEQWMAPAGGLMMGMSRTVARDSAVEFETLRIESRGTTPVYVAHPSGQQEAAFPATTITDSSVVFANPEHDFPTEISYRKVGADSLVARIEGVQGGRRRGISFPMGRVRCGG